MCVSSDTLLLIKGGNVPISKLKDEYVDIWSGRSWSKVASENSCLIGYVVQTGFNQKLLTVNFSNDHYLKVTLDHRWYVVDQTSKELIVKNTLDLQVGDVVPGLYCGIWDSKIFVDFPFNYHEYVIKSIEDQGCVDDTYSLKPSDHNAVFNCILTRS